MVTFVLISAKSKFVFKALCWQSDSLMSVQEHLGSVHQKMLSFHVLASLSLSMVGPPWRVDGAFLKFLVYLVLLTIQNPDKNAKSFKALAELVTSFFRLSKDLVPLI